MENNYNADQVISNSQNNSKTWKIVGIILLVAVAFGGGIGFDRLINKNKSGTQSAFNMNGSRPTGTPGNFGNGQTPVMGTITTISGSTITIKSDSSGSQKIITTDSTTVSEQSSSTSQSSSTLSLSDLKVGDKIAAMGTTKNNQLYAETIILNPSFNGLPSAQSS